MKKTAIITIITIYTAFAETFPIIPALYESGSIVNTTFFGAGAALPSNSSSMALNPAIVAAWHYFSQNRMSVSGIYINDRGAEFYRTGGGGSLALGMGRYVGIDYNLKNENGGAPEFHRGTISYGTIIGDYDSDPLFVGANISYFNFNSSIAKSGLLQVKKDTASRKEHSYLYDSGVRSIDARNNVIAADVGFYQPGEVKGLSWAIVLENIFGYSWSRQNPYLVTKNFNWEDTINGEIVEITKDSTYYEFSEKKTNDFLNKKYNAFLVASSLSLPLMDESVLLLVPLDLRFWGFMNKSLRKSTKLKHRTEIHSGLELQVGGRVCGRFGWAWIPKTYETSESGQLDYKGWANNFSGGFGVNISMFTVDMVFAKKLLGAGLSFQI